MIHNGDIRTNLYTVGATDLTIPTEVIMRMATLGLSEEQAQAVADMLTAVEAATAATSDAGKEKARERWRKWKERQSTNVGKRLQPLANNSRAVEDKPLPTVIEPQESKNSTPAAPSPRQHLETVLTAEQAEAVLQHRKSIKAPLTQRSAKLLALELAKCPDPNAAADTMMLRGWRGFEASWLVNPPRGSPPTSKANPALAAADALMEKFDAVSPSQTEANPPYPRLVAVAGGG
jgi:hypothetical protein